MRAESSLSNGNFLPQSDFYDKPIVGNWVSFKLRGLDSQPLEMSLSAIGCRMRELCLVEFSGSLNEVRDIPIRQQDSC
jgi:hypothetical protein